MLKQRFLAVAVVALSGLGLLLASASPAHAWGHWGYGWGPYYAGYGGLYGGGYAWSYPYWGSYWGNPYLRGSYWAYPYTYSYSYPYSYYGYNYSPYAPSYSYSAAPAYAYDSTYSAPARSFYYAPSAEDSDRAFLRVRVPSANARVWIEGREMSQGGRDREFESPPLAPGRYTYTVRARWQEGDRMQDQTRTVHVRPGRETEAMFAP